MKKIMRSTAVGLLMFAMVFCAFAPAATDAQAGTKPYYTCGGNKINGSLSIIKGKKATIVSHRGSGVSSATSSKRSVVKIVEVDPYATATGGGVIIKGMKKGTATVTIKDDNGTKTKIKVKVG